MWKAIALLLFTVVPGCMSYEKHVWDKGTTPIPTVVPTQRNKTEVMLMSTKEITPWMKLDQLSVTGVQICIASTKSQASIVASVEIANLTQSELSSVLADLPARVAVESTGEHGVVLHAEHQDLTPWIASKRHGLDSGEVRYRVLFETNPEWSLTMTWLQLVELTSKKMQVGWEVASVDQMRTRRFQLGSTIALSVAAVVVVAATIPIVLAVGALTHGAKMSGPRSEHTNSGSMFDFSGLGASDEIVAPQWPATPCDPLGQRLPLPESEPIH
jgi:hypothetical protein